MLFFNNIYEDSIIIMDEKSNFLRYLLLPFWVHNITFLQQTFSELGTCDKKGQKMSSVQNR